LIGYYGGLKVEVSLEIPPKPNSQLIKLIEQTGIKGIVPDCGNVHTHINSMIWIRSCGF